MKRNLISFIVVLVLFIPVLAKTAKKGVCSGITIATVKKHIPNFPEARIYSKKEVEGLCELMVEANGRYYPLYIGKNFVLIGNLFREGKNLTRESFNTVRNKELANLKKNFKTMVPEVEKLVVMKYKPSKSARRILYMFTDPVCPYCARAEKQIKQIAKENDVYLKVLFFPVHRPRGWDLASVAVCKGFGLDTYLAKDWEKKVNPSKEKCSKGEDILKATDILVRKLQITGVPTFILDNGDRVSGANMEALKKMLSSAK